MPQNILRGDEVEHKPGCPADPIRMERFTNRGFLVFRCIECGNQTVTGTGPSVAPHQVPR